VALASGAAGATPPVMGDAPAEWIDPKTGHRITRLSGDEGGSKPYFYRNCFTPQGDLMVFSTDTGIATVELKTLKRRLLVADPKADLLFASRRVRKAYYSISDPGEAQPTDRPRTFFTVDLDSGHRTRIGRIERGQVGAVNADETLLVGTVAYGDQPLQPDLADPRNRKLGQAEYAANGPDGKPLNFAKSKGVRMLQRWAARVPMELFVLDLRTGERRVVHKADDWLNHPQFSPTDPGQIIFSHEGPWHRVTRMWPRTAPPKDDEHGDMGPRILQPRWQMGLVRSADSARAGLLGGGDRTGDGPAGVEEGRTERLVGPLQYFARSGSVRW
jgi:oligogalacturonide lyase